MCGVSHMLDTCGTLGDREEINRKVFDIVLPFERVCWVM